MEGPRVETTSPALAPDSGENQAERLQLRPRRESDAYVETAVAASAAVVSSVDGGKKDPMSAETVTDLAIRASAASLSTATNVALVRTGGEASVDLGALWVPRQGAGMVVTPRF